MAFPLHNVFLNCVVERFFTISILVSHARSLTYMATQERLFANSRRCNCSVYSSSEGCVCVCGCVGTVHVHLALYMGRLSVFGKKALEIYIGPCETSSSEISHL